MKTAQWLEALRSGKYKQAKNTLKSADGGFCCLGVLCDAKGVPARIDGGSTFYIFDDVAEHDLATREIGSFKSKSAGIIPFRPQQTILEDLDLAKEITVDGSADSICSFLISMNDNGNTFAEIADFIEAHQHD